ncbi:cobalamin biosynthesis protein [Paracoccus spongiarum]|uniref:Cobalamin biosynthesis protein n=1 Tax=Paracoccus spongiarum TaxID=3064387 RepID=A0ABT9JAX0_9RHOB|nr:cobalamin biosynthesis protein [Paracoccus sp. 2205BS29-5]MDP5306941.1 cobalamin biosynthesis protein [Paracoccus sp. 2205BS29-5]
MRIAGIGCRAGAPPEALLDALARAEAQGGPVAALAGIALRATELRALGRPLHLVAVAGIATPSRSPRVLALHGTGSVAEAAALAACGAGARIVVARVTSRCGRATAAIATTGDHR